MADAAAFFDLDRTLLRGASGPVITESLRAAGIVPDRRIPGEGVLYRLFDVIGETLPAMLLTRQAARVANGWNREEVKAAGKEAAGRVVDHVHPFARVISGQPHEAGRKAVPVTNPPDDPVQPPAQAL